MKTKVSIFLALGSFVCGCEISTPKTYSEKYTKNIPRARATDCQVIAQIFGGNTVKSENTSQKCEIVIRTKFDFICAYSSSLNEDNEWEFDSDVLDSHLKKYESVKPYNFFEAKTDGESSSPITIVGLAKEKVIWLDLVGPSPYESGAIPTLTIDDGERGTIEKSFLNRVTCIETENIDSKIGLKFGFPY